MTKLYDEARDAFELDKAGGYYSKHIVAMKKEGLHSKSDIAAELAYRDMVIDGLKAQVEHLQHDLDGYKLMNDNQAKTIGNLQKQKKQLLLSFDEYKQMQNIADAEIKAQAVENLDEPLYKSGKADADIGEWLKEQANLIRQQAKTGE